MFAYCLNNPVMYKDETGYFIDGLIDYVNTVVEVIVDMVEPKYNPLAKVAKDTAAGAVLVMAIISALIGIIIFLPKVLTFIGVI